MRRKCASPHTPIGAYAYARHAELGKVAKIAAKGLLNCPGTWRQYLVAFLPVPYFAARKFVLETLWSRGVFSQRMHLTNSQIMRHPQEAET